MYITGYIGIVEPLLGKLPVFECIESLYDHIDEFVVVDASKYDKIDLSKYAKVKRHVRTVFNPFDNPFGSLYNTALHLVNSDFAMFLDADEIFEFKTSNLKDIIKDYPLENGAGVAFSLLNYFCDRNHTVDGCSSKGPHVFRTRPDLFHDLLRGYWVGHNQVRRTNTKPDGCDGVRLVDQDGNPMAHFPPISLDDVVIHHTSHLDPVGKMVRSIIQFNHTSTIDLPAFYPYDMRVSPEVVAKIYRAGEEEIKSGQLVLYGNPQKYDYQPNQLLEQYIKRDHILEFDPSNCQIRS